MMVVNALPVEPAKNVTGFTPRSDAPRFPDAHPDQWQRILSTSLQKQFSGWTPAALLALQESARIQRHFDGTLVYAEGDTAEHLLLVISGALELSIGNAEGKRVVMNYVSPTEMSNFIPVLDGSRIVHEYRTHGKTVLAYIPKAAFLQQLQATPSLMADVVRLLCDRNRQLQDYLGYQVLGSFRSKLAARLLHLVKQYGRPAPHGIDIDLKLSQENLASLLVTSRQSVNRELRWLVENHIVAIEYNKVTVFNLPALQRLSAV